MKEIIFHTGIEGYKYMKDVFKHIEPCDITSIESTEYLTKEEIKEKYNIVV